jgi:transposase-like protein
MSSILDIIYLTHHGSRRIFWGMESEATPDTLLGAIRYFADADVALTFLAGLRWPNGVVCPKCSRTRVSFIGTRRIWKCMSKECRKQFSVKVGTIFEDSPIGLDKWLPCLWMIVNCKNGISSYEVHRALGVTQKTAWFMLHRIRLAMQTKTFGKIGGDVEIDETYIGGKARNMHASKRARIGTHSRWAGKVAVLGLLERHGDGASRVRTTVVKDVKRGTLRPLIDANVEPGAAVYTDSLHSYADLADAFVHGVIDHGEKYADGKIHTNGLENFWSLLKRGLKGTYISVEPFHLFRYLDEQVLRYNLRKLTDGARFLAVAKNIAGRRLTYKALIGAGEPETC